MKPDNFVLCRHSILFIIWICIIYFIRQWTCLSSAVANFQIYLTDIIVIVCKIFLSLNIIGTKFHTELINNSNSLEKKNQWILKKPNRWWHTILYNNSHWFYLYISAAISILIYYFSKLYIANKKILTSYIFI